MSRDLLQGVVGHVQLHATVHFKRACSRPWCDAPAAKEGGPCLYHDLRSDLSEPGTAYRPLPDRFWEKVDRQPGRDSCWRWTASLGNRGYGQFGVVGFWRSKRPKPVLAHRVAWYLATGDWILPPSQIRHLCHNPSCARASHLTVGTHLENMLDAMARGTVGRTHGRIDPEYVMARRIAGATLQEIGDEFGVSRERIRQIQAKVGEGKGAVVTQRSVLIRSLIEEASRVSE